MYGYKLALPLEALALKMVTGFSPYVTIVGDETGIGKTMLAARIAELVMYRAYGTKWQPRGNVFFDILNFKAELFNSKHRIFIMEESEIALGADEWQSIENKFFSRMKSTQRIKGNLYISVLPMLMQLARKHRRAINYIFDVKARGFTTAYKLKKKSAQLLGDELSKFYIGSFYYNLPDCKEEYDKIDHENKKKIEVEHGVLLEQIIEGRHVKHDVILYEYDCEHCRFVWRTKVTPERMKTCRRCKKMCYWDETNPKVIRKWT